MNTLLISIIVILVLGVITTTTYTLATDIVNEKSLVFRLTAGNNVYDIHYVITAGSLKNMNVDEKTGNLVVEIDSIGNGTITIEIPRRFMDWRYLNCEDQPFFVLINGEESAYTEAKTPYSRTLAIPLEQGDKKIEILGNPGIMKPDIKTGDECPPLSKNEWKIYQVSEEGKIFKVPYKISNGNVVKMEIDSVAFALIIKINTESDGLLEITVPRNLLDAKIRDKMIEIDDTFFVLVNGEETKSSEVKTHCFRTLSIEFPEGSTELQLVTAATPESQPQKSSFVSPVYVVTDKNNYKSGEVIAITGCTDLALDDKEVILNVINPQGEIYKTISMAPNMDGTFSTSFVVNGELGIDGTYTAKATYAGQSSTHTFVVPEFSGIGVIILATALAAVLVTRLIPKINDKMY